MEPSLKETDDGQEKEIIKPAVAAKQSIPSIICSACDIQGNVTFGKGLLNKKYKIQKNLRMYCSPWLLNFG